MDYIFFKMTTIKQQMIPHDCKQYFLKADVSKKEIENNLDNIMSNL